MSFLFRHLLLLGVVLGLVGQGVAFAATPCALMQMQRSTAIGAPMAGMPDCEMGQHKTGKGSTPCKDMMPGCLSMAGCAALMAVDTLASAIQAPPLAANRDPLSATPVLIGREVAPDPDPPSRLG